MALLQGACSTFATASLSQLNKSPAPVRSRMDDRHDAKQGVSSSDRKFEITVPSISKLSNVDSARRALERAFQAFPFDLSVRPFELILRSISFSKQVLFFDLGLAVTKLRKAATVELLDEEQNVEDSEAAVIDEFQYARCAWPRASVESKVQSGNEKPQLLRGHVLDSQPGSIPYPHCRWPRETVQNKQVESNGASVQASAVSMCNQDAMPDNGLSVEAIPRSPRSAWPRKMVFRDSIGSTSACMVSSPERVPKTSSRSQEGCQENTASSALKGKKVLVDQIQEVCEQDKASSAIKWKELPVNQIECRQQDTASSALKWKVMPVIQSQEGSQQDTASSAFKWKAQPVKQSVVSDASILTDIDGNNDASAFPRRMLATGVGLTILNQLAYNPPGLSQPGDWLDVIENAEVESLELGRRSLVIFFQD